MFWAIGTVIIVAIVAYGFWLCRDREKRPRDLYTAEVIRKMGK